MIRRCQPGDHPALWSILEPMIRSQRSYALDPDMDQDAAIAYWCQPGHEVFVYELEGRVAATYYLRANQAGGGSHTANCGYVTAPWARGRGIARELALHSLERARQRGFLAMQFNFVLASNEPAIHLWESLGFVTLGRTPQAFRHPDLGLVDALIMHRFL